MNYCVILTSDTGKQIKLAGIEYIDIDIKYKNKIIAALTVRESEYGPAVFDENDTKIN